MPQNVFRLAKILPKSIRNDYLVNNQVLGQVLHHELRCSESGRRLLRTALGLEGIEEATGKNVAGMIIEFIEKNARHGARGRAAMADV